MKSKQRTDKKNTESAERQDASFPNHKVENLDLPNSILN